jgi:Mycothiol maleylpyruvate isomerase N-terminal domain
VSNPRAVFLEAARTATSLLRRDEVGERWDEPSALREMRVGDLAGHLLRGARSVETYLDAAEPPEAVYDGVGYYAALNLTTDLEDDLNRSVRDRASEAARGGWREVGEEARALCDRLTVRLGEERPDRRVTVIMGLTLTLDECLTTRVVELVVHTDDLAASVGLDDQFPPAPDAASLVIATLVTLARLRHGDEAVMRALARRERDVPDALRVF